MVDVTDPTDIKTILKTAYDSVDYFHQGWLTEDHRYFLSNDELDEYERGVNTRTHIFDLFDLDDSEYLGFHEGPTNAVDHNLYIHNRRIYQSNYAAGLRILKTGDGDALELEEVGYFDTYPKSNTAGFSGSWSNYPYFQSGTIIVSDFQRGLFILEPFPSITSTDEPIPNAIISLYPSPVINTLNYAVQENLTIVQIEIINALGHRIIMKANNHNGINVKSLSPGLYSAHFILSDQTFFTTQFIKQ